MPWNYRGYVIDFAPEYTRSKYQFVHEDYDGDEDKRIGVRETVAECMLEIDDQVIERQAKEMGILERKATTLKRALLIAEQTIRAYDLRHPHEKQLLTGFTNEEVADLINKEL